MAPKHEDKSNVSRRDFFKTVGVTSVATSILTSPKTQAQEGQAEVLGPGTVPIRLTINGQVRDFQIEPRVTLLDTIRNYAGLTGNKRVCDRGACGACTMIVDGRTVYSCSTLAIDVQGKTIRTVDGLASGDIGRSADDGVDCGADIDFADGQAVGVFVGAAGLDATDDHAVEALAEVVDALAGLAGDGEPHFEPCDLLRRMAADGTEFYDSSRGER